MYFDLQVPAPVEMSRDELIVLVCEQADRIAAQDARLAAADGQITAMARRRGRLIRSTDAVVDGSAWAQQGLVQRAGRYPLAVGAPVLSIVDTLVPRVSTLTRFARYYALLADLAARRDIG
jgi:hypothetical protein